jgi:hypothetical protein
MTISILSMIQITINKMKSMKRHRLCLIAARTTKLLHRSKLWHPSSAVSRIRLILWRSSIVVATMTRRRIRCLVTMLLLIKTPHYLEIIPAKPTLSATIKVITFLLEAVLNNQWELLIIGITWYQRATHIISLTTTTKRMNQRNRSQPEAVVSYLQACLIEET